jgi:hypothetical protein
MHRETVEEKCQIIGPTSNQVGKTSHKNSILDGRTLLTREKQSIAQNKEVAR